MSNETIDFLNVDRRVPGQNYVCLSFISPDKVLKNKEIYIMNAFFKNFIESHNLSYHTFNEKYKDFLFSNREELEKQFDEENDFKTSVRGIKIRGVYDTLHEARIRAKVLQKLDDSFHVFVGQVGYWLPWDPDANYMEDQEYADGQLNDLMKKYQENSFNKDILYEQEKRDKMKQDLQKKSEVVEKKIETVEQEVPVEPVVQVEQQPTPENQTQEHIINETFNDEDPWMKRKNS